MQEIIIYRIKLLVYEYLPPWQQLFSQELIPWQFLVSHSTQNFVLTCMFQIFMIKLQELMAWKPSALMVLPENLYMMLLGQLWLPGSYTLPRLGGDSSHYERDRIQSVIN